MFTLGKATYLDICPFPEPYPYFRGLHESNGLIQEHFADVLHWVCVSLKELLGDEVYLTTRRALPGFHIFYEHGLRGMNALAPHFDVQFMEFDWSPTPAYSDAISFTLPVELPQSATGLSYWTIDPEEANRALSRGEFSDLSEIALLQPAQTSIYEVGRLCIHLGLPLHRIWAEDPPGKGYRITMQGHGIRTPSGWELYW